MKEKRLKMHNTESIFLFIFIFSVLVISRITLKLVSALLQNPPVKVEIGSRELILIGFCVSYILTYFIKIIL
jgi:hypothetical protein